MYDYEYRTIGELLAQAQRHGTTLSNVVVHHEMETAEKSEEEVRSVMEQRLDVFQESIEAGLHDTSKSVSGLVGGDAVKMTETSPVLLGPVSRRAVTYALAVSEANAKMFKIVACQTAGSCGIVPAALYAAAQHHHPTDEQIVGALFTAAGIGMVIDQNASIAGAAGGCQAECGSAAGMAAGALVELAGGTPNQIGQGTALAIKNLLGLVCDPVAGLVEVPCVKRNGFAAVHAMVAADMALSGVCSAIPVDEVIGAMKEIGHAIPRSLRETSEGGLAVTPSGQAAARKLYGKSMA